MSAVPLRAARDTLRTDPCVTHSLHCHSLLLSFPSTLYELKLLHLRRSARIRRRLSPRRSAIAGTLDPVNARIEPADVAYLMRLTDALNTTLDLQTLLSRTSELVRALIPYRIFAIFLLNDRTHELRMRFQIGHTPQVERTRIPVGKGVVGQVALTRATDPAQRRHHSRLLHRRQSRRALRAGRPADRQKSAHRRDGS